MAALNALPDKYDHLISALDTLGSTVTNFSLEFTKGRLLQEKQRAALRAACVPTSSNTTAFLSTRPSTHSVTCPSARRPKFPFCDTPGHTDSRCYKKNPGLAPPGWATSRSGPPA